MAVLHHTFMCFYVLLSERWECLTNKFGELKITAYASQFHSVTAMYSLFNYWDIIMLYFLSLIVLEYNGY